MYFSLADVRSWKPGIPRSINGLVMQLMKVASVGRGGISGGGDFCRFIGSDVPSLVERNVVARALSWVTWWVRRCIVTGW
jgi:hypothetical protein